MMTIVSGVGRRRGNFRITGQADPGAVPLPLRRPVFRECAKLARSSIGAEPFPKLPTIENRSPTIIGPGRIV
jgi:hypothetical protein